MSMLDVLKEMKEENFDAKSGKIGGSSEPIPEGTYTVSLKGVTHRAKNNRGFLMISLEVVDGDYAGRQEAIFPTLEETTSTGKPMPDFVLARSVKTIKVIGAMVGIDVPNQCFLDPNVDNNYENIVKVFDGHEGKLLTMAIKVSPNRKNPDHPYRNYEFGPAEQPKPVKVDTNSLPFDTGDVDTSAFPF